MKTADPNVGMLYEMIYNGGEVLSRKSLRKKVPYAKWNEDEKEVKSSHPEASVINKIIQESKNKFNSSGGVNFKGVDEDCFLEFMEHKLKKDRDDQTMNTSTLKKYNTIYKNLKNVLKSEKGIECLPFKMLRDRKFVEELRGLIRISQKRNSEFKSNSAWREYMSVISTFVEFWNQESKTPTPVETYYFTKRIGKSSKKKAAVLNYEELDRLIQYEPKGKMKRDEFPQRHAKNVFLFQYFTGGIRIQDALLLTNKQFLSNGVEIRIKKTGEARVFEYYYEMVQSLKTYFPDPYKKSIEKFRVKDLLLNGNVMRDICCIDDYENIVEMSISEFIEMVKTLEKSTDLNVKRVMDSLYQILKQIKEVVMKDFFESIRSFPIQFVFPYLNWELFKDNYKTPDRFTDNQLYQIHLATSRHNSNLKRIAKNLNITKITSHTPRHTLANNMNLQGAPITDIQNVLAHSSVLITQKYVQDRLINTQATKAVRTSHEELNKGKKPDLSL